MKIMDLVSIIIMAGYENYGFSVYNYYGRL